ncbi:unnamed protein product [Merluccius merluccius]
MWKKLRETLEESYRLAVEHSDKTALRNKQRYDLKALRGHYIEICSYLVGFLHLQSQLKSMRVLNPASAFVTDPSRAVLLGMKVQHWSPNVEHTPPFSANNMSNACRFWKAMREVARN